MRQYIVLFSVWSLMGLSAYGQNCDPPTAAQTNLQFNDGQEVRLEVNEGQPGDRLVWYDAPTDGEVLTEGTEYFPMLACGETKIFYVARVNEANSCVSARLAISATRDNSNCRHWTKQQLFDENGNVYSEGIQYADDLGRPTQTQARNLTEDRVLAVQRLYDAEGAAVVQTLPAPTSSSTLGYQENFITNTSGATYNATHFDFDEVTEVDKKDNPDPVGNTLPGTLGWYYSTNNSLEPLTPASSFPYSRSWVEDGPDPKVSEAAGPGDAHRMGAGHTVRTERTYSVGNINLGKYYDLRGNFITNEVDLTRFLNGYRIDATDPDGTETQTVINARGEAVISGIRHDDLGGDIRDYSYAYYNERGQTVATVMPQGVADSDGTGTPGFTVTNEYHPAGWLVASNNPDQGRSEYVYSDDGKLRFSQDARQRAATPQRFSYTLYDAQDRLLESGEYVQSGVDPIVFETHAAYEANSTNPRSVHTLVNLDGPAGALDAPRTEDVSRMVYDVAQADLPPHDQYTTQQFVFGKVAKTERLADDENVIARSWYSYDAMGRLAWMIQDIPGTPVAPGIGVKTTDYTYDFLDNVVQTTYQRGTVESFAHVYTYDADNRLRQVHTSLDEGSTQKLQATYEYYLHGPLKRIELAEGVQGVDMVYTIQGWLKGMNNGDLSRNPGGDGVTGGNETVAPDRFGMTLDYFQEGGIPDYQSNALPAESVTLGVSSNQFGGQLRGMRWSSPSAAGQQAYEYLYDDKYQLTQARYGSVSASGTNYTADFSGNRFTEEVSYQDRHGNFEGLTRRDQNGTVTDDFTYQYAPGTNQLTEVRDASDNLLMSFTYDATGRMTSRTEGSQTQYYVYDAYSMLTGVYEDLALSQPIVEHVYDDRGQRVQKDSYQGGSLSKRTYYVRDVGGNVLAIYEQDVASAQAEAEVAEYPIYGLGRIGSWYALPGDALALDGYQITDGDVDLPAYVPGTTPNYLYRGEDVVTLQQGFEVSWQQATDNMFHVASVAALRDEDSERYELADHLGNVRVTVGREKAVDNTAETIGYTDYYPFGQALPSQRSVGSPKYRFGFQGAFAEDETEERGVVAFELRDWDPVIGRWLAPDPMGQYASPYLGMGNSPVNRIDPDGGFDEWNIINGERQWVSNKGGDNIDYFNYYSTEVFGENSFDYYTHTTAVAKSFVGLAELGGMVKDFYFGATIETDRFMFTDQSTISSYTIDGSNSGYFLEPRMGTPTEAQTEGSNTAITAGTYHLNPHNTSNYSNVFRLVGVPGRTAVLIHAGNYPADTRACLLPGCNIGPDYVGPSGPQLNEIRGLLNGNSYGSRIIIRNPIPYR